MSILDHIGDTPLIPLARISAGLPVPVLAKCEHLNPGGSVKDRIALAIVDEAERRGELTPGDTLVEATAGNTGLGLALVAAVRGYRLVCVIPRKMSPDKARALELAGAEVRIVPDAPPDDPDNFQQQARRLAAEQGWFLTDQFENPANPAVHQRTTGPEIIAQTDGRLGAFVAGVGTGGTITGVGRCLRERGLPARVIIADPVGSVLAGLVQTGEPGEDGSYAVEGIGISKLPANLDLAVVDDAVAIDDDASFAMARRLIREEGLHVGGSAGTAVAAAVQVARSGAVSGPVVALLADHADRYHSCGWMR